MAGILSQNVLNNKNMNILRNLEQLENVLNLVEKHRVATNRKYASEESKICLYIHFLYATLTKD
jgi:hypothetical protein